MANCNVSTSYVSEQINRVRFCPEQFNDDLTTFVTGGANAIKFWKILKNDLMEDDNEYVPKSTACVPMSEFVTGLEFLDFNNFAVTSADGGLNLIYINRDRDEDNLKRNFTFPKLHSHSCSGVSVLEDSEVLATVGEDGVYNIISSVSHKILRSNKVADSTSISCCCFVSHTELLTGNSMGIIKVFNVSAAGDKPVASLAISCEDEKRTNRVTSICHHPTQIHIVLAGSEEGSITVFDLRQPTVPASYLSAHEAAITEIGFHQSDPTKLFTAAENGDLWQWQQNTFPSIGGFGIPDSLSASEVPWLNGERAKNSIAVSELVNGGSLAINSFDSFKNKVVAAGDNEAVYLIEQLY